MLSRQSIIDITAETAQLKNRYIYERIDIFPFYEHFYAPEFLQSVFVIMSFFLLHSRCGRRGSQELVGFCFEGFAPASLFYYFVFNITTCVRRGDAGEKLPEDSSPGKCNSGILFHALQPSSSAPGDPGPTSGWRRTSEENS